MERLLERTWARAAAAGRAPIEEIDGASDALALFDAMEASVSGASAQLGPSYADPGSSEVDPGPSEVDIVQLGVPAPLSPAALDQAQALRLDTSGAPSVVGAGGQELSVSAISMNELHPIGRPFGGARAAVAFDADRPVFRRRMNAPVHSVDESLRAERDQRRRESVLAGALVFLLLAALIASPAPTLLPYAAVIGAIVGIASCELGGGVRIWAPASVVASATMLPFTEGLALAGLAAALALGGTLIGLILGRT